MRIKSRSLARCGGWLAAGLLWLLSCTWRVTLIEDEPGSTPVHRVRGKLGVACTWHEFLFVTLFSVRSYHCAALTSEHRDGDLVEQLMARAGVKSIRGSSSHGGRRAMAEMIRVAQTHWVIVTPDGPRGPAREMKAGPGFLASKSGNPLYGVGLAASSAWNPRLSWTSLMIPKPFARVAFVVSHPIILAKDASRDEIDQAMKTLAILMVDLEQRAQLAVGRQPATPVASTVPTIGSSCSDADNPQSLRKAA